MATSDQNKSGLPKEFEVNVGGVVAVLNSSFLLSMMLPSLVFIIVIIYVFEPTGMFVLPIKLTFQENLYVVGALVLILTAILGFLLSGLNTYILKLFEGYVFLNRFDFLVQRQKRKANELAQKRERLLRKIQRIEKRTKYLKKTHYLAKLKNQYYSVAAEYDTKFPPSIDQVLPTGFGNILRAAEAYPGGRYGIDAVSFWPRLFQLIPDEYKKAINETRNELSFFVNAAFLAGIFFIICLGVIIKNIAMNTMITNFLIAGAISLVAALFFYRASLISVRAFGSMIRSAYDLFRFDLLKQLRLKMPKNSNEEFDEWKNLGEFIVLGSRSLDLEWLIYDHPKDAQSDTH